MKNNKVVVKSKNKKYPIIVGSNILKKTGSLIKKNIPNTKKVAIITDGNLPKYILDTIKKSLRKYNINVYKIPSSEKSKNISTVSNLINKILKQNLSRSDSVIALGGGVTGDIAGLVASLVKRGLRFVNIPTSLLAQVDASIGGKTGVNSIYGKNLIGSFYQPDLVISDMKLIQTLPKREIICGYAEIIKHALILDRKFFTWLLKNGKNIIKKTNYSSLKFAVIKSCKIKTKVVEIDEKEKNFRMVLNFGHTFGHALESVKKFSKRFNHGEGVLLGMILAINFSFENNYLKRKEMEMIKKHYIELNLPMKIKNYFHKKDLKKILYFMKGDKKNNDQNINLILIKKIGQSMQAKKFSEKKIRFFLEKELS